MEPPHRPTATRARRASVEDGDNGRRDTMPVLESPERGVQGTRGNPPSEFVECRLVSLSSGPGFRVLLESEQLQLAPLGVSCGPTNPLLWSLRTNHLDRQEIN